MGGGGEGEIGGGATGESNGRLAGAAEVEEAVYSSKQAEHGVSGKDQRELCGIFK